MYSLVCFHVKMIEILSGKRAMQRRFNLTCSGVPSSLLWNRLARTLTLLLEFLQLTRYTSCNLSQNSMVSQEIFILLLGAEPDESLIPSD